MHFSSSLKCIQIEGKDGSCLETVSKDVIRSES